MDDRALVYRGADQPDMSVINPESDVWQHIKVGKSCTAYEYCTVLTLTARFLKVISRQIGRFDIPP
jgi:hypothetical protein